MFDRLKQWINSIFSRSTPRAKLEWQTEWSGFLDQKVAFYRVLSPQDKQLFQQRVLLFLQTTSVEAGSIEVSDEDCLLVAASAVIPVWAFPKWHYFNLNAVYLLPGLFNDQFECGQSDSTIAGMVGTGPMSGKLALSLPHLYSGFENSKDKQNVGIHEFAHLIDMADGDSDGFPERLREFQFAIPWFDLVNKKRSEIDKNQSNIRAYGATNNVEFFSVATEYFFERPKMLKSKHPILYRSLASIYQQDALAIANDIKTRKKAPCPCGSGKRYKRCCMPQD